MAVGMNHDRYSDNHIRGILENVRTVAIVGASPKEVRPSYFVARYLIDKGYRVFPINPGLAGGTILGCPVYARLLDVPEPLDMVDIFRSSEYASRIVEEALRLEPLPKVIWMQIGVRHEAAALAAEAAGLKVVMNRCPKIEYGRLSGEISWVGVNSRVLSSKKPVLRPGYQHRGLGSARPRGAE
jgi:predicted CoA-binding protein